MFHPHTDELLFCVQYVTTADGKAHIGYTRSMIEAGHRLWEVE
jgi:hypothetical protein